MSASKNEPSLVNFKINGKKVRRNPVTSPGRLTIYNMLCLFLGFSYCRLEVH